MSDEQTPPELPEVNFADLPLEKRYTLLKLAALKLVKAFAWTQANEYTELKRLLLSEAPKMEQAPEPAEPPELNLPEEGEVWTDPTTGKTFRYDGNIWRRYQEEDSDNG